MVETPMRSACRQSRKSIQLAAVVVGFLFAGGASFAQDRVVPRSLEEVQLSYALLVEMVAPAVVNIYTQRLVAVRRVNPLFDDPIFERFFGRAFPETPRERIENSLGSGVIVSSDGVIVLRVERGPASRLGIRPGVIVVEVAEQDINTTETLAEVVAERRVEWPIAIDRDGEIMRVEVRG